MNIHPLTIIGILIIGLGTYFMILGQQKINDRSDKELKMKSEKIETLSEENKALLTEVNKLNKKIASNITGGDSCCYFLPSRPSKNSSIVDLMLINDGDYPLYDVSVKIDDVEKLMEI
jgi:hypothetical protein